MPIAVNDAGEALALSPQGEWKPTQIAQNPQTGERLAFDGTQWQAIPKGADPSYEWSDVGKAALRGVPIAGGLYERNMAPPDKARAENFDAAHPWISGGAKMAGGAAALGAALVAAPEAGALALGLRGATLPAQIANSAVSGAAIGGADALARGEPVGRAAAIGGALGAVAPPVGRAIGNAISGARSAVTPVSRVAANELPVGNVKVPLTGPEAAGDVVGQRFIENARQGTLGDSAKEIADRFGAERELKLGSARDEIRGQLGGAETAPLDAAIEARDTLRGIKSAKQAEYHAAYDVAESKPGHIGEGALQGLGQRVAYRMNAGSPSPVWVDPDGLLTPAATRMMRFVDEVGATRNAADPWATLSPGRGISNTDMMAALKKLSAMRGAAANPTDARAAGRILDAFRGEYADMVGGSLYAGDKSVLGDLKHANALFSEYMRTFEGKGPLGANIIKKMAQDGATDSDIVNWLWGASQIRARGPATAAAEQLKSIYTQAGQPEAWQALRQGLLSKLLETPTANTAEHAQRLATRLGKFLDGDGRSLAEVFYAPQERALIKQYAQLMERMTPIRGAVNHSGTAYHAASLMKWTIDALASVAGLHVGGPIGLLAGPAVHGAASAAAKGMNARAVARQIYNPAAAPRYAPNSSATPLQQALTFASRAAATQ